MIEQQFTGLLGAQLRVLGGLTVQLVPRDSPQFVQKRFQAQSLLNQLPQFLLKSVTLHELHSHIL
jgi:hypothetical protein